MREMVKRYDRDTLLYKLKSMQLFDEATLLVYLGSLHDIGARKGAGRPKGKPTKTIAFRVKLEHVEPIKHLVKEYITLTNQ